MPYIASFDIGTTHVKGVLISSEAHILLEQNVAINTIHRGSFIEQNPQEWMNAIVEIATAWFTLKGINPDEIALLTFSGQMQDCIPVNGSGLPVRDAILYSDGRATEQAMRLCQEIGNEKIRQITGNHMDGTIPFPKVLWLREEEAQSYQSTKKILISSKDYVIYQLTKQYVTDATSAATSGMMNLRQQTWEKEWLHQYGISEQLLPTISPANEVVGTVTQCAAQETGFAVDTPVLCGIGDAGAATIGAGVTDLGDIYAYMGTTGWIATLSNQVRDVGAGAFHLSYLEPDQYLVIPPIMNAGNIYKWAVSVFDTTYQDLEKKLELFNREQSDLLFLPYLNGERSPIQDLHASGSFVGLRPTTCQAEMGCAMLEGVAMAMKQVRNVISNHKENRSLTLIGGGSRSTIWNQIIADVFAMEVNVPEESQYLPALGAGALGFIQIGWEQNYSTFATKFRSAQKVTTYRPNVDLVKHYEQKYEQYIMLYPALKEIFAKGPTKK